MAYAAFRLDYRGRLYLFVVQSGHQDFRDAMPIYISHGRFQAASACATSFEVTLIAEASPVLGVVY
jgi:hypothetical protein